MMEKVILMIRPEQRMRLLQFAKQQGVFIAKINRRISAKYISNYRKLDMLADVLIKSNREAKKALHEAELAITNTIEALRSSNKASEQ